MLNAMARCSILADAVANLASIIHLAIIMDVRQSIPLGRTLQRHFHEIVGKCGPPALADRLGDHHDTQIGVGSIAVVLRSVAIERQPQRKGLARPDFSRGPLQRFRPNVVQRSARIVGTPAPPIPHALRDQIEIAMAHHASSHGGRPLRC